MLEHDAPSRARDPVRRPSGHLDAVQLRPNALGRSIPMISFITVDLPDPWTDQAEDSSPGLDVEADILHGQQACRAGQETRFWRGEARRSFPLPRRDAQ